MNSRDQAVTASWINVVAGAWLIISPFILGYANTVQRTNDIWLGAIVGILALIRAFTPAGGTTWLSWLNIIAGVWLIISPFALGTTMLASLWNDIILGVIVTLDAIWNSAAGSSASSRASAHT